MESILSLFTLSKNISAKTSIFILLIAIVIVVIYVYSNKDFYVSSQSKIQTLKDLYELRGNKNLDSNTIVYLNKLQEKILNEYSVQEYITDYISSIFNPTKKSLFSDGRNEFLQFLTSSYFWLFVIFAIPVAKNNPDKNLLQNIYIDVKTFFVVLILAIANSYLFNLIPLLKFPFINYIVNAILQFLEFKVILMFQKIKKNELRVTN